MTEAIEEILAPKPVTRPRIHACAIDDPASSNANDPASGSANGAVQARPRATPWVAGTQHPFSPEGAT